MNVMARLGGIYSSMTIPSWDDTTRELKKYTFAVASYLTDPVCSFDADRMYLKDKVFTQLFPCDGSLESRVSNWIRKSIITTDMTINLLLTPFTAPIGILLRCLGSNLSKEPFIYETTTVSPKAFPADGSFSLDNWNVLLIPGENSILHGGAPQANSSYIPSSNGKPAQGLPYLGLEWLFGLFSSEKTCTTRLDTIIEKIRISDADLICLYEGFDFSSVEKIKAALKDQFHCMISNIAPRSVGTNSGVVILSKFQIPLDSLHVEPFPKEYTGPDGEVISLGDNGYCEKSMIKFSIVGKDSQNQTKAIANIFPMHLMHSSSPEPEKVTLEEKIIRAHQLDRVFKEMNKDLSDNRAVIGCGDLNLDPKELQEHPYYHSLKGQVGEMITWGGDTVSAAIEGIHPSGPQQLDYVLALSDTVQSIETEAVNCGNFDPSFINWEYCSDHYLLKTKVHLNL